MGWPAAADVCQANFERFPESLWIWLNKAWIFRYAGRDEQYRQVVSRVLTLAPSITSTNDQHVPVEIAALGPFEFSAEQVNQLDALMKSLQVALPGRGINQQVWGYRAIGQMQLQLGRFPECLNALEKSAAKQTGLDPYNLFIKAICLHRLNRHAEARAAFEEGEKIMKPLLAEPQSESEGFLSAGQLYQQALMCRETRAALAGPGPKPSDFADWAPVATNSTPSGKWSFTDTQTSLSQRFYRTRIR